MAIPPNMSMYDFQEMQRGKWMEYDDPKTMPHKQIKHTLGATAGSATGTEALVCEDIAKRQQLGVNKYGTTVCANPLELREWLQHAYEEALDQAIYLKRAIQELDKKQS